MKYDPAVNAVPLLVFGALLAICIMAAAFVLALVGEAAADRQLAAFKSDRTNAGRACRRGLWRFSRHPNYFFAPLLMFYFLVRVTGIPATEAQAPRSRGSDYRDYQRTTSAFFPWFWRR